MIELNVCPSTLAEGFTTYSPTARKTLFDGRAVSHVFRGENPHKDSKEAWESFRNIGRISLSGVQSKFSAVIGDDGNIRYGKDGERGTFILKPNPTGYHLFNRKYCAANENVTMQIASQVYGISTAANALCFFDDGEPAYITRRFDIGKGGAKHPQEDFAALMGYTKANGGSDYKYINASYEECAEVIRKFVKASAIDILRFFQLILFNFISLNDDAHLKNFSLIKAGDEYRLSPAYDLINTSIHLAMPRIFALNRGLFREGMEFSDVRTIRKEDFIEFGRRIGLPEKIVLSEINRFSSPSDKVETLINNSFLSEELKRGYLFDMRYRQKMLTF